MLRKVLYALPLRIINKGSQMVYELLLKSSMSSRSDLALQSQDLCTRIMKKTKIAAAVSPAHDLDCSLSI